MINIPVSGPFEVVHGKNWAYHTLFIPYVREDYVDVTILVGNYYK